MGITRRIVANPAGAEVQEPGGAVAEGDFDGGMLKESPPATFGIAVTGHTPVGLAKLLHAHGR